MKLSTLLGLGLLLTSSSGLCGQDVSGTWKQITPGVSTTTWTLTRIPNSNQYNAVETGGLRGTGTATYNPGNRVLRINFRTPTLVNGFFSWTLDDSLQKGSGILQYQINRRDQHPSTLSREVRQGPRHYERYVRIHNDTNQVLTLSLKYFSNRTGQWRWHTQANGGGFVWTIQPGANVYLLHNGKHVTASMVLVSGKSSAAVWAESFHATAPATGYVARAMESHSIRFHRVR